MRYCLVLLALFLATIAPIVGQSSIPHQKLLLLVAGPSGDRIDPTEQAVVNYLNELRGEYNLYNLQMGTMHFDRPRERQILTSGLGFNPNAGVTVGLVQLSDQGYPVRALYKSESVTPNSLRAQERQLMGKWSQLTGEKLPQNLQSTGVVGSDTSRPNQPDPPNITQTGGPPDSGSIEDNGPKPSQEVYSFEGIRTVVTSLNQRSDSLWGNLKNAPLREDRMDVPVREATVRLHEASNRLLQAHQQGIVYPLDIMQEVRRTGRQWKLTEPRIYLPVELRKDVQPILDFLEQLEAIEYQGRKG